MLRPLAARDIPEYGELYRRYFPEEARVLLTDAGAFQKVLRRAFHWDARLILGFLQLIGRPIGHFYALEADGRLAGVTFLFFEGGVGYIASVAVDLPYRRRGYARKLVQAAEADALRRGCKYAVLDVIDGNLPALQLYKSMDYHSIRRGGWYYRDLGGTHPILPEAPTGDRARPIRPFRKKDGTALAEIARGRQPSLDRAVRPVRPGAFAVAPMVTRVIGGETQAFVRDGPGGVEGFVRSSSSGAMGSGNLVPPLVAPTVPEEAALDLLDHGLAWFQAHPVQRIVTEVHEDDRATVTRLTSRGFERGLGLETLAKSL
jgi:ribosomal protein S18 acetylase RimI-like enzyme